MLRASERAEHTDEGHISVLDFDGVRADSAELLHCKNFVFHVSLFLFYRKAFVLVVKQIITTYTARKGTTSQIYSKKQVWIFEN